MKEPVNQLEFVQKALDATPRNEWEEIAAAAKMSKRHLYNVVKKSGSPSYDVVYALLRVFEARRASRSKRAKVPA